MARVIAIANQKGGVGKTTSTLNIGAALAERHQRTLLVDMDPQGALTASLGVSTYDLEATLYSVFANPHSLLSDLIVPVRPCLDLVPANVDLAAAELNLSNRSGREFFFKYALAPTRERYDFILIDCQPSLGLLTVNALTAADEVIIPVQCQFLSLRGMRMLLDTIEKIRVRLNPSLELTGILGTMYNTGTIHSREVLEEARKIFGAKVFNVVIKESVRFAEAPVVHKSILEYESRHDGAAAYRRLAEVLTQDGQKESQPQGAG